MSTDETIRPSGVADALDRSNFDAAAAMLAPSCRYGLSKASLTSEGNAHRAGGDYRLVSLARRAGAPAVRFLEYFSVVERVEGSGAVLRTSVS